MYNSSAKRVSSYLKKKNACVIHIIGVSFCQPPTRHFHHCNNCNFSSKNPVNKLWILWAYYTRASLRGRICKKGQIMKNLLYFHTRWETLKCLIMMSCKPFNKIVKFISPLFSSRAGPIWIFSENMLNPRTSFFLLPCISKKN